MKDGNWIPLDKNLVHFLPRNRPYTILEAMFSYRVDMDNGDEKSIIAYSRIWSWSRTKVRRFIQDLKELARHTPDRDETGTRHEVVYKFNNLDEVKDKRKTGRRQGRDSNYNPNPKPIKNTYAENVTMTEDEYRKLVGEHGEEKTAWMINKLNCYKGSSNKKYESDYMAILSWVVDKAGKEFKPKQDDWRTTYLLGY